MKYNRINQKKMYRMLGICVLVLIFIVVVVIESFKIYHEKKEYDDLKKGMFENVLFAYTLEDQDGNKTNIETIPEGNNYEVTITCDNGAIGVWNYEEWGPLIKDLTSTRTKCKINFGPVKPLFIDFIKGNSVVTSGEGLYEVSHNDASITYTTDQNAIQNLKQTEYRYAGSNPSNYVTFNNELWRIIGLVNTPEGSRMKLIRKDSIGDYAWYTSDSSINSGQGINDWNSSNVKNVLNNTYYNNLDNLSKEMIDQVTWNTGSNGSTDYATLNANLFYNIERSSNTGKICGSGSYCNDTVKRTTTWTGLVGAIYPSDYGYATIGGSTTNRTTCLNTALSAWNNGKVDDCFTNNWLRRVSQNQCSLTSRAFSVSGVNVFRINGSGKVDFTRASSACSAFPIVYLKTDVKVGSGNGSIDSPYTLAFE